jgi:hypothetical protein
MEKASLLVKLLALGLALAACNDPAPPRTTTTTAPLATTAAAAWSTDDFQETVAFCASLEEVNGAACPEVVTFFRDGGCSVEEAYVFIGQIASQEEGTTTGDLADWITEACEAP